MRINSKYWCVASNKFSLFTGRKFLKSNINGFYLKSGFSDLYKTDSKQTAERVAAKWSNKFKVRLFVINEVDLLHWR
jgi:hypothetical protein